VDDLRPSTSATETVNLRRAVRSFTRQHILDVLAQVHQDKRAAAHVLGISLASLYRKLSIEPAGDSPGESDEEE
jgi:transcriptional regulator with PAS, ATPase and Fis domain